ncbi:unnamed protein product [Vicia faba]|uniref:RRM domain-containing protein n=1 Tax=Vicia faba TaxID=3906 RepID=A0AAV0YDG7_VICFA|nr:unnamed protein product [Vicia faba]
MRALQNKPLQRRKLDIHFSIPKDNPSDKDINQVTLVAFNLDPSVSSEDLRQIFGAYGEVKEIRETPHKRHHKFIEFYDVRAAIGIMLTISRFIMFLFTTTSSIKEWKPKPTYTINQASGPVSVSESSIVSAETTIQLSSVSKSKFSFGEPGINGSNVVNHKYC